MRREWLPLITIILFAALAVGVTADDTESPSIELITPESDSTLYYGQIDFKFKPNDNSDVYRCKLYVDEDMVRSSSDITKDSENTFSQNLLEGTYKWSMWCEDSAGNNRTTSNRSITVSADTQPPNITLQNFIETEKKETIEFNYTVVDNGSGIEKCELIVDENVVQTSTSITENESQHFTYGLAEGDWAWSVKCTDNHANYKQSDSSQVSILLPPQIELVSPDDNQETVDDELIFKYIPKSTRKIERCDLWIGDELNQTSFDITKDKENSFELTHVPTQLIEWTIQCRDSEEVSVNASARTVIVTTTEILESAPPAVMLVHPIDITIVNKTKFSYKASSELLNITICELFIDDLWNETDAEVETGVQQDFSEISFELGNHSWYVLCIDDRDQSTFSENSSFIVTDKSPEPVKELQFDNETIEAEKTTMADILGQSGLRRAVKIVILLLIPLIIVILVLMKELQGGQAITGLYSKRE